MGAKTETERFEFDAKNRLITEIRRDGSVLNYVYNPATDRLAQVTDGAGRVLRQFDSYDARGTALTLREFNGLGTTDDVVITRKFNSAGEMLEETTKVGTNPAWTVRNTTDKAGNRTSLAYPATFSAFFSYNEANALKSVGTATGGAEVLSVTPNGFGRVGAWTANGTTSGTFTAQRSFDKAGRLSAINYNSSIGNLSFTRTPNGLKSQATIGAKTQGFGYDSLDRLTMANYSGATNFLNEQFRLDELDNRTTGNLVNGVSTDYSIVDSTRIRDVETPAPGNPDFTCRYDGRGNTVEDKDHTYQWDTFNRLTRATKKVNREAIERYVPAGTSQGPSGAGQVFTINLGTRKPVNVAEAAGASSTTEFMVETLNLDGSWREQTITAATDISGGVRIQFLKAITSQVRITEKNSSTATGVVVGLVSWYPWGQVQYSYDGLGRRVGRIADGVAYLYVFDGYRVIEERLAEDNSITRQFVYGEAINDPVSVKDLVAGRTMYVAKDDLNGPIALLDEAGAILEKYEYTAYGETRILNAQTGQAKLWDDDADDANNDGLIDVGLPNAGQPATPKAPQVASDFGNPFGFAGMWRDSATGLYHTHFREYNPSLGRWLTPDPAGYRDGQNLYAYYPGPNGVDVLGLSGKDWLRGMWGVVSEPFKATADVVTGVGFVFMGVSVEDASFSSSSARAVQASRARGESGLAATGAVAEDTAANLATAGIYEQLMAVQDFNAGLITLDEAEARIHSSGGGATVFVVTAGAGKILSRVPAPKAPSPAPEPTPTPAPAPETLPTPAPPKTVVPQKTSVPAGGKGIPKPTPKFQPPTNPPQMPPEVIPPGWRVRVMPPTEQYPNGYWKLEKPMVDGSWQPIDPSTMKPGGRPETHVPFPPQKGG
ncbi:MAG: RHS repeat-associated core domain-containing protein [Planctomycetota bacterium]